MRRVIAVMALIILALCLTDYKADTEVQAISNDCQHRWQWKIDLIPSCAEKGYRHQQCTRCAATRNLKTEIVPTGKHEYENACDAICNVCEKARKVAGHSYKNKCDSDCNICGAKRYVGAHKYATNCDNKCVYCGYVREKVSHKYTNVCDSVCNNCGKTREIAHNYFNSITKATMSYNGKIKKKCKVCGSVAHTTVLYRAKTVELKNSKFSYTGKVITPEVIAKDSKGKKISSKYYSVKYSKGRKAIGTYKVTVTFKGIYYGKKVLTFKINPKATTITTLKSNKNGFTVKYKKQGTAKGYQVQYSTSKKFTSAKTVKVTNNKTISKTIKKLKARKNYYVRVRTYKKIGNKTYCSNWSKAKKVKVK